MKRTDLPIDCRHLHQAREQRNLQNGLIGAWWMVHDRDRAVRARLMRLRQLAVAAEAASEAMDIIYGNAVALNEWLKKWTQEIHSC